LILGYDFFFVSNSIYFPPDHYGSTLTQPLVEWLDTYRMSS
jgi:hypothetical protein